MHTNELVVPKTFVRPWEEIVHNKNRIGLGYNKDVLDVSFHIRDFSKPIQFRSAGFLDDIVPEQIDRYQHCDRVGHVKYWCFDLHLCEHCGKHNHHSNRYSRKNIVAITKLNFGWIASWDWSKTSKKFYRSYHRICSRVLTNLIVIKSNSSSHIVLDKGGID